jgi:uncharacterized membrane protein YfcA
MEIFYYLVPLFFLAALVYSTAGLGGGSTYLALLALFSFPYSAIPKVALLCNLIVVTGGLYLFFKAGYFSVKKVLPFVVTSIPAAYIGGSLPIGKDLFSFLLALSLLFAALRMLLREDSFVVGRPLSWRSAWVVGLPLGAVLGAFSGLVGIGGGIFLSPLLFLLGWADARESAAAASFFILVNSVAGLLGQFTKGGSLPEMTLLVPLGFAVFLGGQIGSRLGANKLPKLALQRVTAVLILFASIRLFWGLAEVFR